GSRGHFLPSSDSPFLRFCSYLGSGELPAGFELAGRSIGQLPRVQIDLDLAATQVAANELLGQRIFDVTLDGAAQRTRAVRAVLAGDLDNPVDDFGRQGDLELPVGQVLVQLVDQQLHDPPQVVVGERLEDDDLVDAVDELGVERA